MQNLDMEPDKDLYDNLILPQKESIDIDKVIRKIIKKLKIKIERDNDDKKVHVYIPEVFIKKLSEDYSDVGLGKRVVWRDGDYIFAVFGVEKSKLTKVCKDI